MQLHLKHKKGWRSFGVFVLALLGFVGLMLYALNRNPNAIPSQLVGQKAPTIDAPLAQGGTFHSQSAFAKNRWVVINFWNTSCVVCRHEAPDLERFYRTSSEDPTSALFLSVNIQESTPEILEYAKFYGLSFPIITDTTGRISLDYGVYGTPETFFVDPQGIVRHRIAGAVDFESIPRFIEVLNTTPIPSPPSSTPSAMGPSGAL